MNRFVKIFFISLLFSTLLPAEEEFSYEQWKIDGKIITILFKPKERIRISNECEMKKCEASTFIKNVTTSNLNAKDFIGGKSLGDQLCKKNKSRKVVFGLHPVKGNTSFCQFNDGSYISTSAIDYYSEINSSKQKQ